ncbi:DUF3618 domain-containing protein [Pseudarthrobacter sp. NBSH8]|uniref:DUF3618 domain-containing protein n=1 Tax=Pseudarthrobacter sp. NBSH8 TaxID=2596911 RepID=UPI001629D36E|nr:DUF3618 domain-containing protein [Pseudarthrobacter sp. NBSH8]QNE13362.1 DUF3618 domain-containing protein [Pseudarthrobacter sp. NBSH8]
MSDNPDVIRSDIEATRARLGTNVDAVADKVTPSNIVHRQTDKVKDAVFGVKEKVMGTADDATGRVHGIGDAPHQVKAKTQGNPLAAGLIAFGAGLLLSSLIPASEKEREAADALKSAAEPLTAELTEAAKEIAEGLKEPAREAMENVKATAADAAEHVKTEGQVAAADVKDRAADARENVQNT